MKIEVEVPAAEFALTPIEQPAKMRPALRTLSYVQQQQQELNALPPALRKQRVKQLRLMRRFAKGSCYHPTPAECERVFGNFRRGPT